MSECADRDERGDGRRPLASTSGILVALIVAGVIYILINYTLTTLASTIEKRIRLRRGLRPPTAAPVQVPNPDASAV